MRHYIERNEPNVHKAEKPPNVDGWHGAELSVIIEGNWTTYRNKVLSYLRQGLDDAPPHLTSTSTADVADRLTPASVSH